MGKSITDLSSVTTVGLDLAKHVFQVHGVDASGRVVVAKAIRRNKPLEFFASLAPCLVELEASGSAHHWARELITLGHDARMMPPAYVKPYIRRQKNDASDASAICEAVTRPSMRFVGVRSLMNQAALMRHKAREMLVTQRTQLRSRSATGSFMARRATAPAADVMGRMPAAARGPALNSGRWLWSDGSPAGLTATIENGVAQPKQYQGVMPPSGGAPLSPRDVRRWRHTFGPSAMSASHEGPMIARKGAEKMARETIARFSYR
jgi:hypothetical protein